jgi:hypothetical protein
MHMWLLIALPLTWSLYQAIVYASQDWRYVPARRYILVALAVWAACTLYVWYEVATRLWALQH